MNRKTRREIAKMNPEQVEETLAKYQNFMREKIKQLDITALEKGRAISLITLKTGMIPALKEALTEYAQTKSIVLDTDEIVKLFADKFSAIVREVRPDAEQ